MTGLTPEEADRADADPILVTAAGCPDRTRRKHVTADPVRKGLPAVADGGAFEVPDETRISGIGVRGGRVDDRRHREATGVRLPGQ